MISLSSQGFTIFMRVVFKKITPKMLEAFFWARKLRDILHQKLKLEARGRLSDSFDPALSLVQGAKELSVINRQNEEIFKQFFEEIVALQDGTA